MGPTTVLRVVLPSITCPSAATNRLSRGAVACTTATNWLIRWPVPPADVAAVAATNIRVAVEIVVSIDGDVVVAAHPHPQPQPPLQNAPIITPMPKEIATPAA